MANATLLQLVQRTMQGMGVVSFGLPATVIDNTNSDVVQLLALVNMEADEIAREHDWEGQRAKNNFEATFFSYTGDVTLGSTTIANMSSIVSLDDTFMVEGLGIPQDTFVVSAAGTDVVINREPDETNTTVTLSFSKVRFAIPDDMDRQIDRTHWDTSQRWEMLGPETQQQFEWLRSGYISTGPRVRYTYIDDFLQIWPPQGVDKDFSFSYLSKNWIYAASSTTLSKQVFTVDTDTTIFPDALMYALIRLKYFEIKGFNTDALQKKYSIQLDLGKGHDGGSPTLSMAPSLSNVLIGWENLPDSGYGT